MQTSHHIRLSVRLRACHKAQFLPVSGPSRLPAPRQHILGITPGLSLLRQAQYRSWGILLRHGMRPGRLLLPMAERARDGFPRSVCPFGVTLGGCFTLCLHTVQVRRVRYECSLAPLGTQDLESFPFGPASAFRAIASVGWLSMTPVLSEAEGTPTHLHLRSP